MTVVGARERIAAFADSGSFVELSGDVTARSVDFPLPIPYADVLERARERSGELEAVVTGVASLQGHPIALAVFDFRFMGGTMGVGTGRKVVTLFERATRCRLPVVTVTSTGGVRTQEGILALLQMAAVGHAARRHRLAGLLQFTVMADPSFGGVPAGFALAADIVILETGARFGFTTGGTTDGPASPGSERIADFVVAPERASELVRGTLAVLRGEGSRSLTAAAVKRSPQLLELAAACDGLVSLGGNRRGRPAHGWTCGFAQLVGRPFAWIGLGLDAVPVPGPDAYANIRRHVELAQRLGLPVVSVIDTPGADASQTAQAENIAGEIAETLGTFVALEVPTMSVVVGQGGSGGAMALAAADRVVVDRRGSFHVLPPDAAASLLLRGSGSSDDLRPWLRTTARDLLDDGFADAVIDAADSVAFRRELESFLKDPPSATARARRWSG